MEKQYFRIFDVKRHPNQKHPFAFKGQNPMKAALAYAKWQYGESTQPSVWDAASPKVHDIRVEWSVPYEEGSKAGACMGYAFLILKFGDIWKPDKAGDENETD